MTLMTVMTINCRGSLNGVLHSAVGSRDRATGREPEERKAVKERCRSGTQSAYFFQNISCCSSGLSSRSALGGLYSRGTSSGGCHPLTRHLLSYFSCLRVARPVARDAPRAPRGSPPPPERSAQGRLGHSPGPSFPLRRAPPTVRRAILRRRTPGQSSIARRPGGAS